MGSEDEPIYILANDCKELFSKHTPKEPPSVVDTLLQDYQQRFFAWCTYLGVFADESICLDRRIRRRPDISDIVVRLLDIIAENLEQLIGDGDDYSQNESLSMDVDSDELAEDERIEGVFPADRDLLEAIEESLTRLNRLGSTIRQSSVTSRSARVSRFAETVDLTTFENLSRTTVSTLYPDAGEGLQAQLTRSMVESCAKILYKKQHQERLTSHRSSSSVRSPATIEELDENRPQSMGPGALPQMRPALQQHHSRQPWQFGRLESTPTTLNTITTRKLMRAMNITLGTDCRNDGASSVQLRQATYPPPPRGTDTANLVTCDWCLEQRPRGFFDDEIMWNRHLDTDFEPYVCISEKCMNKEKLPCYSTFKEWLHHMNNLHSPKWQQEVHKPVSWACSIDHDKPEYFPTAQAVYGHMTTSHLHIFTADEAQAIGENSQIRLPRPREICPLCCRDLVPEKRRRNLLETRALKRLKLSGEDGKSTAEIFSTSLKHDPDQNSEHQSDEKEPDDLKNSMARHIASHMQTLMFLTMRIMKFDTQEEDSVETGDSDVVNSGDFDPDSRLSFSSGGEEGFENNDITSQPADEADESSAHHGTFLPDNQATNSEEPTDVAQAVNDSGGETMLLIRRLPAIMTAQALHAMLSLTLGFMYTYFVPSDLPEDDGYLTAIALFNNMTVAVEVRDVLNGGPKSEDYPGIIAEVLNGPINPDYKDHSKPLDLKDFRNFLGTIPNDPVPDTLDTVPHMNNEPADGHNISSHLPMTRDNTPTYNLSTPIPQTTNPNPRKESDSFPDRNPVTTSKNNYPPCNTLYVGNMPPNVSEADLKALFIPQRGFKRLSFRYKDNRPLCFVQFEDTTTASAALSDLHGSRLPSSSNSSSSNLNSGIRLSFARNPLGVRSAKSSRTYHQTPPTPTPPQRPPAPMGVSPRSPPKYNYNENTLDVSAPSVPQDLHSPQYQISPELAKIWGPSTASERYRND